MPKITLYALINFQGGQLTLTSACPDLRPVGFNNAAGSLSATEPWVLYSERDYQGDTLVAPLHVFDLGAINDQVSSLRPIGSGPRCIALFQHSHYRGRMVVLGEEISNLKAIDFNDQVTSVVVVGGTWALFSDANYSGKTVKLSPGNYIDSAAVGLGNDVLSSLRPI
ncbi:MAG: beta/gamma crystallin-related protein [Nannocystaceae bacterium]